MKVIITCVLALFFYCSTHAQSVIIYGPETVCVGDCANYTAVATTPPGGQASLVGITWTGSNGFASNNNPVLICFDLPGIYVITATAIYSDGSTAQGSQDVFVTFLQPIDIQSINGGFCPSDSSTTNDICQQVCPFSTVTYSSSSSSPTGSGILFWTISGAESYVFDTLAGEITVHWGAPGYGSVTVIGTNCSGEDTQCVEIIKEPTADFAAAPAFVSNNLTICKGQTVYFQNASLDAEFFHWTFGDGTSSEAQHPEHTFFYPGTYTVELIARSGCACADTIQRTVEVLDAETPTLDCISTVCAGEITTYTANSSCTGFQWTVSSNGTVLSGGGLLDDSITVQWNSGPSGTIALLPLNCATNTCTVPLIAQIPVLDDAAEITGPERVCPEATATYAIEAYAGADFNWSVLSGGYIESGQGTPEITVKWTSGYSAGTAHKIVVWYNNCYLGCQGRDTLEVHILEPFKITGPVEVCAEADGLYNARLAVSNTALLCQWTLVNPANAPVWSSGAATANPTIPFPSLDGLYRLLAIPSDPTGTCLDQAEWFPVVHALPDAPTGISGVTPICPDHSYNYEATGVAANLNVLWQVKNGPSAQNVQYGNTVNVTWDLAGPYWLTAATVSTNGLGCKSDTVGFVVEPIGPFSLTGPAAVCAGEKTAHTCPDFGNLPVVWSVNPADAGTVAAGQGTNSVEIYWYRAGNFTVEATVCGQTATQAIMVHAQPTPLVLYPAGLCPGAFAPITTQLAYSSYRWKDADGVVFSNLPTNDLGPGTYSVLVTDVQMCSAETPFTIAEFPEPNLTVSTPDPTGFCNNARYVTMHALTTDDGDYAYSWFRDGLPLGFSGTDYSTNQYGDYTVVATNQYGCTASAGPITVFEYCGGGGVCHNPSHPGPCAGAVEIQMTPTAACNAIHFENIAGASYIPGTSEWHFGESGASYLGSIHGDIADFTFPNAGWYIVVLYAEIPGGTCIDLDSIRIPLAARFKSTARCSGELSEFKDLSTFVPGITVTGWSWDFGDAASGASNTSNVADPSHSFTAPGTYLVTLVATASTGCTSTYSEMVVVPDNPAVFFSVPAGNCAGNALEFQSIADPNVVQYNWDFGDSASGGANFDSGNPSYHRYTDGNYIATLEAENVFGCTATVSQPVSVLPNTLTANIVIAPASPLCEGEVSTLTANHNSVGAVTYAWSNGSAAPSVVVGEESVTGLTVTDANGCLFAPSPAVMEVVPKPDGLIKAAILNDYGQIIAYQYPDIALCAGEDLNLVVQGPAGSTYHWSTGGSGNSLSYSGSHVLAEGTYIFTVTVTDPSSGCTAVTAPFNVTIHPRPANVTIASNAAPPCAGMVNTLEYTGPDPGNWQFLWNTGVQGKTMQTANPGAYFITAMNPFGCTASSEKLIIKPGPNIAAIPAGCHRRCAPDTLCMPNLPDIASWQWYYNGVAIPGATSSSLIANQSGDYYAEVSDYSGCEAQSGVLSVDLIAGTGNVLGHIWADVNDNGLIDPADTVFTAAEIGLLQGGLTVDQTPVTGAGTYLFPNIPANGYVVKIDESTLPIGWQPVIDSLPVSISGCDHQYAVDLLVRFKCTISQAVSVACCMGDSILVQGIWIQPGAVQTVISTGICDTVMQISCLALPIYSGNLSVPVCVNDSILIQGIWLKPGQNHQFSLQTTQGCDSLVLVSAVAIPNSAHQLDVLVCPGGSFTYAGQMLFGGDTQVFTLVNAAGCDSVLTITVMERPVAASSETVAVCSGSSFTYQGMELLPGDTASFVIPLPTGCDSTHTVAVVAWPAQEGSEDVVICPGTTYAFAGMSLVPGDTAVISLPGAHGCDSVVTVRVAAFPIAIFSVETSQICPDSSNGYLTILSPMGGAGPYEFALNQGNFQLDSTFENLVPGTYQLSVRDQNGCIFMRDTVVEAFGKLELGLTDALLSCDSGKVQLQPIIGGDTTDLELLWWDGSTGATAIGQSPGKVWIQGTNHCETILREASITWDILPETSEYVYVPNVFAPESDEAHGNQTFRAFPIQNAMIKAYQLDIYDRWGNHLFTASKPEQGWNGIFKDKKMNPGVFVWVLDMQLEICGKTVQVNKKGDVTIVR